MIGNVYKNLKNYSLAAHDISAMFNRVRDVEKKRRRRIIGRKVVSVYNAVGLLSTVLRNVDLCGDRLFGGFLFCAHKHQPYSYYFR